MLTNLSDTSSLLSVWIRELRDLSLQGDRMRFSRNLQRIGTIAAYEISKTMLFEEITVQTPMGEAQCLSLPQQPVIASLLRAGIPLQEGLLQGFDAADSAFVAGYRRHHRDGTFEIAQEYITCPDLEGRTLIVADAMLATGASLALALETLHQHGRPAAVHVVSAIACTEGIEHLFRRFPEIYIWAGAVDEELTAKGYIVPGLGDAGDLAYGPRNRRNCAPVIPNQKELRICLVYNPESPYFG